MNFILFTLRFKETQTLRKQILKFLETDEVTGLICLIKLQLVLLILLIVKFLFNYLQLGLQTKISINNLNR